jgi:hypothetical protein
MSAPLIKEIAEGIYLHRTTKKEGTDTIITFEVSLLIKLPL